jgi:DNA-binding response OmpR family regulator
MQSSVLIVEDTDHVRQGLQIALESQGYRVISAEDGRQGINRFRDTRPDIVLLDIRMPRMSGIDVCTLIRNESDVPVIMFSGVDERADILLAIQRGANDYVLKDTGFRELLNRVEKHLKRRSADVLATSVARQSGARLIPFKRRAPMAFASADVPKQPIVAVKPIPAAFAEREVIASPPVRRPADLSGLKVKTMRIEPELPKAGTAGEALENLIIVAHSDTEALKTLARIAGHTNYEVIAARTGQEAIEALATRRPKLVVAGNTLTDMSCFALVEAVAQMPMGELIGIVIATSRRSPELARKARYLGVHETVFLPWEDGSLDVAIRSALAATRQARIRVAA